MKMGIIYFIALICFSANASIAEFYACGTYKVSTKGEHLLEVQTGSLPKRTYEVLATNRRIAKQLNQMKPDHSDCMDGYYEVTRPQDGISITAIRQSKGF